MNMLSAAVRHYQGGQFASAVDNPTKPALRETKNKIRSVTTASDAVRATGVCGQRRQTSRSNMVAVCGGR